MVAEEGPPPQLRDAQRGQFLTEVWDEYKATPGERERRQRDIDDAVAGIIKNKKVKDRQRSRWSREQQRRAGTSPLWKLGHRLPRANAEQTKRKNR